MCIRDRAQTAGLVTGDTITVNAPDGSPSQLTISGIYENAADTLTTENTNVVLLTLKGLADFDSSDLSAKWQYAVRFSSFCNVLSNITDIIRKYKISETQVVQNMELLSMLGQVPGSNVSETVSYTHLDVYKRQPFWLPAAAGRKNRLC